MTGSGRSRPSWRLISTRPLPARERLIQAIKDGVPAVTVKDDPAKAVDRLADLETILSASEDATARLHPDVAERHSRKLAASGRG